MLSMVYTTYYACSWSWFHYFDEYPVVSQPIVLNVESIVTSYSLTHMHVGWPQTVKWDTARNYTWAITQSAASPSDNHGDQQGKDSLFSLEQRL